MKSISISIALATCLVFSPVLGYADHGAHEHGHAKMNIALEGNYLSIELDSPLDNLLGFEHEPKNDKQRQAVRAMTAKLNAIDKLFVLAPEAECTMQSVKLNSSKINSELLEMGPSAKDRDRAGRRNDQKGHGDLEARYIFNCARPENLKSIEVTLFKEFRGMREIEVQVVTPKRQIAAELTPKKRKIAW